MDKISVEKQLEALNQKIDLIVEEAEKQRREREKLMELKDELVLISKESYKSFVYTMDEMSDDVSLEKINHLVRTLARNTDNIRLSIERLEKFNNLIDETSPIVNDVFKTSIGTLDDFAKKGYFDLLNALKEITYNAMDDFSPEDVERLKTNSKDIGRVLKNLSDPEVLSTINCTVETYREFKPEEKKVSFFKMLGLLTSTSIKNFVVLMAKITERIFENKKLIKEQKLIEKK